MMYAIVDKRRDAGDNFGADGCAMFRETEKAFEHGGQNNLISVCGNGVIMPARSNARAKRSEAKAVSGNR